jgi:hypothetical protein
MTMMMMLLVVEDGQGLRWRDKQGCQAELRSGSLALFIPV